MRQDTEGGGGRLVRKGRRSDVNGTPKCCELVGGVCKDSVPETREVDALVTVQWETHFPDRMPDVNHHGSNQWLHENE